MDILFYLLISLPLLGFGITILVPSYHEKLISRTVNYISGINVLVWAVFLGVWLYNGAPSIQSHDIHLYQSEHYNFTLSFLFDKFSAVYIGVTALLSFLITKFSRYYLHKEEGYKRFFLVISLFICSVYIITLSGNLETLFMGWEVLGISSFLLIAFYRERFLPVRNAMRVYTYYRLADAGLILTMWLCHHLWHHNVKFVELTDAGKLEHMIDLYPIEMTIIGLLIGLAAAVKSAQFPFSTWLARAMEGPTPSSAIFYGSIAVNIGCFLLLRTYPLWSHIIWIKVFFILLSIITIMTASVMSRTQSNVKAAIAYSSIVQIGFVFIEITLGFHTLALIHFSGNAFLRAYQLLISPSIVTYQMREQFFNFTSDATRSRKLSSKIRNTLLVAGLKEWRIDSMMYKYIWLPLKSCGRVMDYIPEYVIWVGTMLSIINLYFILVNNMVFAEHVHHGMAFVFCLIATLLALQGFTEKNDPLKAWTRLVFAHVWLTVGIGINEDFSMTDTGFYMAGVILSGIIGGVLLRSLQNKNIGLDLHGYKGLHKLYPVISLVFFISAITMAGFPLSTTFLGEDLLLTHIEKDQVMVVMAAILMYIIEGIALLRIYARLFLGPYQSNESSFAKRYS